MNLLNEQSLPHVLAQCFFDEARHGDLWVPVDVSENYASALAATVRSLGESRGLTVHVDTDNGTQTVWSLAEALTRYGKTTAEIGWRCKSAGLIIACACERRVCKPHTQFLYHGSPYKRGIPDDRAKAQWFASRTTTPEDVWFDMARGGDDHEFGAEKALELGIVHEVVA